MLQNVSSVKLLADATRTVGKSLHCAIYRPSSLRLSEGAKFHIILAIRSCDICIIK